MLLKLRAPEIPTHSFHGSYDLNPVDAETENRGRRTEIMLFLLSGGCRAVSVVKHVHSASDWFTMGYERCDPHPS